MTASISIDPNRYKTGLFLKTIVDSIPLILHLLRPQCENGAAHSAFVGLIEPKGFALGAARGKFNCSKELK
jgi:hypothetical protein